jgi:hypothetical protein
MTDLQRALEIKRQVREARRKLHAAKCTCPHGVACRSYNTGRDGDCDCSRAHDSFRVKCERASAEIDFDGILIAAGFAL